MTQNLLSLTFLDIISDINRTYDVFKIYYFLF